MYKLEYQTHIDSAHHLKDTESLVSKKCLGVHGHRWEIIIRIETDQLQDGMIIDFGMLKTFIQHYDHQDLNNFTDNPTAENLSKIFYDGLKDLLSAKGLVSNLEVQVYESPDGSVIYNETTIL